MCDNDRSNPDYVIGRCLEMCPQEEIEFRTTNKMVHILEKNEEGGVILVKQFSRSAAGSQPKSKPEELRPPEVCLRTSTYLVHSIFASQLKKSPAELLSAYNFVFDRLRAVRQDLVVQQGDFRCVFQNFDARQPNFRASRDGTVIAQVLELCVHFHLMAGYLLCQDSGFDSKLNFSHLLECLKTLIVLQRLIDPQFETQMSLDMGSVYLLLNLGSPEAIRWGLELPETTRSNPVIRIAMKLHLFLHQRNFVAIFKRVKHLPLLQLLAFHWNLAHLYGEIMAVMSSAYNSEMYQFPMEHFCSLFLINDPAYVEEICQLQNIETTSSGIKFVKSSFVRAKVPDRRWFLVDEKLEYDLLESFSSLKL